ncbi:MAG: prephenate dehydratase [Crocinitomicaceae bacterium]|nr:prephenate dehydratase [Crocinitomicaceae bacterium]
MKQKIAIQGVKGAFHEEAAVHVFGNNIEIVSCLTFQEEIGKLENGEADAGIMAIENTISGTILNNLELIRTSSACIVGEVYLRIHQNLGGIQDASISELREVRSHYMALNQCRDFFGVNPEVHLVEGQDTALCIREVAELQDPTIAAIGSRLAIEQYGLELLVENIETDPNNFTRFAVLKLKSDVELGNKVSLSLVLKHESGALSKVLTLLHLLNVNLTKIESVPMVGKPFQYRFFLDLILSKNVSFESMKETLTPLAEELNIMGRYKSMNE